MKLLFWAFSLAAWIFLLLPLLKGRELKKEQCRKLCRYGCGLGILATVCFVIEMMARNQALWKGDISEQLLAGILSITMIPLGVYIVIFVIAHIIRK